MLARGQPQARTPRTKPSSVNPSVHLSTTLPKNSLFSSAIHPWSSEEREAHLRQKQISLEPTLPPLAKGDVVIDVCSLRPAMVLGTSSTHCKVCFKSPTAGDFRGAAHDLDAPRSEIVPLQRLRGLRGGDPAADVATSPRWGIRRQPALDGAGIGAGTGGVRGTGANGVGFLLACVAAPQSLKPKPARPTSKATTVAAFELLSLSNTNRSTRPVQAPELEEEPALLTQFKTVAASRFGGCLGAAWRFAIDVRGAGKVGFQDFVRGGRLLGFTGNFRKLWAVLMGGRAEGGHVCHADLDPAGALLIREFCSQVQKRGLTLEDMWEKHFDKDGSGRCLRDEFLQVLYSWDWDKQGAKHLFRMLDAGHQNDITLDELEHLGLPRRIAEPVPSVHELRRQRSTEDEKRAYADFHGFMIGTFRNLVRGWRALDSDGDGRVRFSEFCSACKEIGFRGRVRTLWRVLDRDSVGFITLQNVHPLAWQKFEDLRIFLEERYLTLDDAWERVFDPDRLGRCPREVFLKACREKLGWSGNAVRIFTWLDYNFRGDLTIHDMQLIGLRRRKVMSLSARQKVLDGQEKDREEADGMLRRFKTYLTHHYGSVVHAWRLILDPDGDGKLQFAEFCARCRQIHFQGNLKALWLALDTDEANYISLDGLEPSAVAAFADLLRVSLIFFDNLETFWHTCLDPEFSGRCNAEKFRDVCRRLRYHQNPQQLFRYLDFRFEGFISIESLVFAGFQRTSANFDLSSLTTQRDSGPTSRAALEDFLKIEYGGSITRGWRLGFCGETPPEKQWTIKLDAEQFFGRCRALGIRTNFATLWNGIQSGSFEEEGKATDDIDELQEESCGGGAGGCGDCRIGEGDEQTHQPVGLVGGCSADELFEEDEDDESMPSASRSAQVDVLGRVSLADLDSRTNEDLAAFSDLCTKQCGDADNTWKVILQHCVETNMNARLREVQFAHAARQMGFGGNASAVFAACNLDRSRTISAQDLGFLQIGKRKGSRRRNRQENTPQSTEAAAR